MYYISIVLLFTLFLSGCSTTTTDNDRVNEQPAASPTVGATPASEIENYKDALTLLNSNQLDAAETLFKEFTTSRPELAGPWTNLALIYIKKGDLKQARSYLKMALKKNPNMPQALNLLGSIEYKQGNIKLAEKFYKKAIENKPNYAIAHYNLALLYDVYYQDLESALPHYKIYLKLINNEDKVTLNWVEQIKNSMKKN